MSGTSQEEDSVSYGMNILFNGAKHEFRTDENSSYLNLLRSVYGVGVGTR